MKNLSYKVVIERSECTSCGNCELECPEHYEMDQEGLAHLKESKRTGSDDELELEDLDCALDAALSCPAMCIHVYEDGEEIS